MRRVITESAGFILIESLCMVVCLMVILTAWYQLRVKIIQHRESTECLSQALLYARSYIEEVRSKGKLPSSMQWGRFQVSSTIEHENIFLPKQLNDTSKKKSLNFDTIKIAVEWHEHQEKKTITFITGALLYAS